MNNAKKKKLEAKGWKVGTVSDFLKLSQEEAEYIELKLALSQNLQKKRIEKKITQEQLAKLLHSSQSRVAKMETGDATVSLDLLIRSLIALGSNSKSIGKILSKSTIG